MDWLPIVLIAYFVLGVSTLVDKILLSSIFNNAIFYVIWVSLLSLVVFILFPYASWIGWYWFAISLITGGIFTLSLFLMYTALQKGEASRIVPMIGGAVPVLVFLTSYFMNLEEFTTNKVIAFIFLVSGSVLMTLMPGHNKIHRASGMFWALAASLSFSAFFLLTTEIFKATNFIDGIVWPRTGTFVVVVIMLLFSSNRQILQARLHNLSIKMRAGILFNQGLAATGFLGQNYAIDIANDKGGSLSIIMALQGVQYAFILIIAALASWKFPHILEEKISRIIIAQKLLALLFIGIGLYYITI